MVFNLCSSAGVQGVFVLLFLAGGGPIEGEDILGSSVIAAGADVPEGPDIVASASSCVEIRLLFLDPECDVGSCLNETSVAVRRTCTGEDIFEESTSALSARFDIECRRGIDALRFDDVESEVRRAEETM